ncbi:MAG TPA: hypothetical protein VKI45_10470 [Allosphingosinicella sp.]|nr:hypothetical protein [Allosphingosinicella sp.]
MRFLPPALLLLLASACSPKAVDIMQAPPAALRDASYLYAVDLSLGPDAKREVAAADARVKPEQGYAGMRFAALLPQLFKDAAAQRGMKEGRALTITVELDHLRVPAAGGSLVGRHDRLAGQVRIQDSRTGQALGSFYVDVDQHFPGLIGLAVRGGGVREKLASAFVRHVLDQIAPAARR